MNVVFRLWRVPLVVFVGKGHLRVWTMGGVVLGRVVFQRFRGDLVNTLDRWRVGVLVEL